jgi:hypothetical protein
MTWLRSLLAVGGLAMAAYGVVRLLQEDLSDVVDAFVWLGAGVLVHDGLVAPATLVLMAVSTWVVPEWLRGPVAAGFVVLATVTVAAVPVLGRFGARPDNPTLLDRDYGTGWLVLAALVALAVAAAAVRNLRRARDHEVRR